MSYRKKLIEVSLPLDAINKESIREGYIYKGNPSAIHKWWSGKPLATSRAVLFATLVDDPSSRPDAFPTKEAQQEERKRLFNLIAAISKWENLDDQATLKAIKDEILKSTGGNPLAVFDPFCGGGSIPLEAQRLGLQVYASDLNPVAVVINKALIEIPPRFANCSPVNTENQLSLLKQNWYGAEGLASDIKYYGRWMYEEAQKRIGDMYPQVKLPKELGNEEKPVMAWLWARAVECPNPACGLMTPLVNNFWLSTKTGKKIWVQPFADYPNKTVKFKICTGTSIPPVGTVNRRGARCIICDAPIPFDYIRAEGGRTPLTGG